MKICRSFTRFQCLRGCIIWNFLYVVKQFEEWSAPENPRRDAPLWQWTERVLRKVGAGRGIRSFAVISS